MAVLDRAPPSLPPRYISVLLQEESVNLSFAYECTRAAFHLLRS